MKRIVILVALVLILAGAGGAGWWFFLREAPEEETMAEALAAKGPNDKIIIDLAPIVVPILREGQVIQHLTLVLKVELTEPEDKERIVNLKPRLRNALLKELHGVLAFRHINRHQNIMPIVRLRLKKAGNDVFGPGRVNQVLIQGLSRRTPSAG